MPQKKLMQFIIVVFFFSCNNSVDNSSKNGKLTNSLTAAFTKDIPTYKDGPHKGKSNYLYTFINRQSKELNLDFIETGYDSLQIRVWLGHSLAHKKNVVVLKNSNSAWSGQLITYTRAYDENGKGFISEKSIKNITPRSGWVNFIKTLYGLQILQLQNGEDLPGYNGCGMDGLPYLFEKATTTGYRFYTYCNIEENKSAFWQAQHVADFATRLENEFDFAYIK